MIRLAVVGTVFAVACAPSQQMVTPPTHESAARLVEIVDDPGFAGDIGTRYQLQVLHGRNDKGQEEVLLAVDSEVLLRLDKRDHVAFFWSAGHYDKEYLVHVVEEGGPGTCVWERYVEVYQLRGSPVALDKLATLPTGGYLRCADGVERACGCGSWSAVFRIVRGPHGSRIETRPYSESRLSGAESAPRGGYHAL